MKNERYTEAQKGLLKGAPKDLSGEERDFLRLMLLPRKRYLPQAVRAGSNVEVFIGPEGDFSSEEIDLALAHGFVEITLGNQRLRTETAALTAVVMVAVANTLKPTE